MTDIDKADLEAKLREIEGVVLDAEEEARNNAVLIAVGVTAVVVGIVVFNIWRARKNKIKVEVYKL